MTSSHQKLEPKGSIICFSLFLLPHGFNNTFPVVFLSSRS